MTGSETGFISVVSRPCLPQLSRESGLFIVAISPSSVLQSCCLNLTISISFCLRAEGVMRTMSVEKLLKGMPTLQSQIDALLEFDVSDTR